MGRNVLKLDANAFNVYAEKLDRMGGDLKTIFTDALEKAGQKIGEDTTNALAEGNLPRGGQYSTGQTKKPSSKTLKSYGLVCSDPLVWVLILEILELAGILSPERPG